MSTSSDNPPTHLHRPPQPLSPIPSPICDTCDIPGSACIKKQFQLVVSFVRTYDYTSSANLAWLYTQVP